MTEAERRLLEALREKLPENPSDLSPDQWTAVANRMRLAAMCIEENIEALQRACARGDVALALADRLRKGLAPFAGLQEAFRNEGADAVIELTCHHMKMAQILVDEYDEIRQTNTKTKPSSGREFINDVRKEYMK